MFASRPTCALVGIYKSSKQTSNLAGVCSKRATLLSNVDRANRKSRCGSELTKGLDVKRQVFAPGGHDRDAAPEYFGFMGVAHGTLQRHHSGKGRAVPERSPSIPPSFRGARAFRSRTSIPSAPIGPPGDCLTAFGPPCSARFWWRGCASC